MTENNVTENNVTENNTMENATMEKTTAEDAVQSFDVVVVGAGVQGVGIAQAIAAQGWRVAVIEKNSEAGLETSSKSSKLIHGGLRYLETLQVKLVFECLRERRLLLQNAPSLVELKPFYLPVYKHSQRPAFWIRLGLSLYSILGGLDSESRFKKIPKSQWSNLDGLAQNDLVAVYQYSDAQTNDKTLTQAVLRSAQSFGAETFFNTNIESINVEHKRYYIHSNKQGIFSCAVLINATGPWVNTLAELIQPEVPRVNIDLVKGSHIIIDIAAFECCYYLESPDDGRAFFVLPWEGKTMIGTTEQKFDESLDAMTASDEEIDYLIRGFQHYFPRTPCSRDKLLTSFAGVRVLPGDDSSIDNLANTPMSADEKSDALSKSPTKKKRETIFLRTDTEPFYCGVYGGKLTSYRATADKVLHYVRPYLPALPESAPMKNTKNIKLD